MSGQHLSLQIEGWLSKSELSKYNDLEIVSKTIKQLFVSAISAVQWVVLINGTVCKYVSLTNKMAMSGTEYRYNSETLGG